MKIIHLFIPFALLILGISAFTVSKSDDEIFLIYQVNLKKQDLKLYWKDDKNQEFKSIQNLKNWLGAKKERLIFATNAGMYKADNSPLGLFIQDQKMITPLNTRKAAGNFYWKPNGVLYIDTGNNAVICTTENFKNNGKIKYATQSGPMLVINGKIHPDFKQGSTNLNIRNGVGVLPNNDLVFIMSKREVSLFDFAKRLKELGCKNALSFDGFVSRTYQPEKNWIQTDGNFGVIVGVTTHQ
ncbi:hypothetical protein Q73A0000_04015 [Kaistella flava (ex Peng et al. 2021)]|uniref:Phosphodiester glycosidase domain-containing protein n=1 Tax=Kaistella flava (ex Peng et al. 2021) TaxID=2038776 RepID=A0A7M2Y6Z8_9FLAO|nr:phosphodiester glycosidase family protein [Kaistella flava (ex Peng et al. 2021)]QOW09589.1 hypothetical protein Q73A0000_04015 [Kaistella flava (ex Peng et al. 2021)]